MHHFKLLANDTKKIELIAIGQQNTENSFFEYNESGTPFLIKDGEKRYPFADFISVVIEKLIKTANLPWIQGKQIVEGETVCVWPKNLIQEIGLFLAF